MGVSITLPELNISEEELRLLLAAKLLDEGMISLGKASEIAGYSERAFAEVLLHKKIAPVKYRNLNLDKELFNA
jgi:predicted HTH domain antitoxin